MAKLINSGSITSEKSPNILKGNESPTRGEMELSIGLKNEWLWNNLPVTGLLNVSTVKCDYYSINVNETTYGNSTKEVKTNLTATFFDKINNFTIYQRDSSDIEDETNSDRGLNIHLGPKQSIVLGQTQLIPKENDHIILHSQIKQGLAYPYRVTKVTPVLLNQQESFIIEYAQSKLFKSAEELDARVVVEKDFIEKNVGTGNQVLFDKETSKKLEAVATIFNRLTTSYTEAFYDEEKDVAAFDWKFRANYNEQDCTPTHIMFIYAAIRRFQEKHDVLKYGFYNNTLFVGPAYPIPREEANYNNSLYAKLIDKDFCKISEDPGYVDNITSTIMQEFLKCCENRDYYNEDHGIEYTPQYAYRTKLYFLEKTNHSILSRFYMSGIITCDMIEMPEISDGITRSSHVNYTLKSPAICRVLDAYMSNNRDSLIRAILGLKRYSIDRENLDDYFGIPLLLYVVGDLINSMNGKFRNTYYG